jgi:chemotaxis protein CheD
MCHCILPSQLHTHLQRHNPHCCVDTCVNSMVEDFARRHKVPHSTIKAKIFGGANVLQAGAEIAEDAATIGRRNIEAARRALRDHDLPLVAECVGGEHGYKVFFNTENGEVFLRRVKNSRVDEHDIPIDLHRKN